LRRLRLLYLAGILPHLLSVWSFLKTLAPHEPRGFFFTERGVTRAAQDD